jgi:hypothetical protein
MSVIVDAFDDSWNVLAQPKQTSNKAVQLTLICQSHNFTQIHVCGVQNHFFTYFARIHFKYVLTIYKTVLTNS